jgi:hypothetical protein
MTTVAPELLFTVEDYLSMPEGGPRYAAYRGRLAQGASPEF